MYQLFCDSNSEIPYWFAEENGLKVVSMPYVLDNQEYYYDLGRNTDFKHFFQREREGSMPTTAALNVDNYIEIYEPTLKEGTDILMLSFSSALSGTHESLEKARLQLLEKYPERSFQVVNTLGISMGAGLLVYYATQLWKNGAGLCPEVRRIRKIQFSSGALLLSLLVSPIRKIAHHTLCCCPIKREREGEILAAYGLIAAGHIRYGAPPSEKHDCA